MASEAPDGAPLLNLDGYTDLPPGKIAAIVTFLEMRRPPPAQARVRADLSLEPLAGALERYRVLYRRVGEAWLWFSRPLLADEDLAAVLNDPEVAALALTDGAQDLGLVELDFRTPGDCELAFLGVVPEAIGSGLGRFLIGAAIERAFERPIQRLWLHTCTLDHPGALAFYRRAGFVPYRRAIEVADDPRLTGGLPPDAAPDVPVIA
jgi:ribosomal protein S18 acetylase RimI-like enzyme